MSGTKPVISLANLRSQAILATALELDAARLDNARQRKLTELVKLRRQHFDAIMSTPECEARDALRARLIDAKHDDVIAQSETCIDLIDLISELLVMNWMPNQVAADVIRPLSKHFTEERNSGAAAARAAKHAAERGDPMMFALLDEICSEHPGIRPKDLKVMLKQQAGLTGTDPYTQAAGAYRRWKDRNKREGNK